MDFVVDAGVLFADGFQNPVVGDFFANLCRGEDTVAYGKQTRKGCVVHVVCAICVNIVGLSFDVVELFSSV